MSVAAGGGLASAGAQEAGAASHWLLERWGQPLHPVALGWAWWTRVSEESGVCGSGLSQPGWEGSGVGGTDQQAGSQVSGLPRTLKPAQISTLRLALISQKFPPKERWRGAHVRGCQARVRGRVAGKGCLGGQRL